MAKPKKPQDVLVVNGWYLDIPVPGIGTDAIFETLEGVGKSTGVVQIVDAGSNHKHNFGDQLVDYSEMTLTRAYQNNAIDRAMEALVTICMEGGQSFDCVATKMHHGKPVFSVLFEGFQFKSESHPTLDISSGEKYVVSYGAVCSGYTPIPV